MSVHLKQINDSTNIEEWGFMAANFVPRLLIITVGLIMIIVFHFHFLTIFLPLLVVPFLYTSVFRKYFGDYAKKSEVIGEILFDSGYITSTRNGLALTTDTSNIQSIVLTYNYVQGKSLSQYDGPHNGMAKIELITKSNETITMKFVIEKMEQLDQLIPIWKEYYKKGIKITELMGHYKIKTALFTSLTGSSYKKIQELKKELNTDHFE